MMRAHRPLHTHLAPPEVPGESEHTREVVAGELAQWAQVCSEIAAGRYRDLVEAGDPDAAEATGQAIHEIAGQLRTRAHQWGHDHRDWNDA